MDLQNNLRAQKCDSGTLKDFEIVYPKVRFPYFCARRLKWSRGWIYGCITARVAWQTTYREWMLSIGFVECQNVTSMYHHKERDMIVSCFVDDPIVFAKTTADETWYHTALDARVDIKHHSYLSTAELLTYCGTQIHEMLLGKSAWIMLLLLRKCCLNGAWLTAIRSECQ